MTGVVIWLVAGTLAATLFFAIADPSWVAPVLFGLDAFGYRLAIGSLVVVGVFLLLRWIGPKEQRPASAATFQHAEGPSRGLDLALWVIVITGLLVWGASSVATEALFRLEFGPFGESPRPSAVVAQLVSTMAFRAWTAALVLSVLLRLPFRGAVATSAQPPSED